MLERQFRFNMSVPVRRAELSGGSSPSHARSPSPTTLARLQSKLAALYAPATAAPDTSNEHVEEPRSAPANEPPEHDAAYAFRLFAPGRPGRDSATCAPARSTNTTAADTIPTQAPAGIVRIDALSRSPSPASQAPGAFVSPRPASHYFAAPAPAQALAQLRSAAVSGEEVRATAGTAWPGCKLAWRVAHIGPQAAPNGPLEGLEKGEARGRKRPGKKRRVMLHRKAQRKEEAQVAREARKEEREAAERDKRVRLNRAKNVRRRAKEKAKRAEKRAGEATGGELAEETSR